MQGIDFSAEAMEPGPLDDAYRPCEPADPWLRRRTHAWGASEVGPLLVAYGLHPLGEEIPAWVMDQARHYQRLGVPRLLAWKAGLRARPKGDKKSKGTGRDRERELYQRFKRGIARRRLDPRKLRHADSVPREWFPLVDRHCTALACTPDAWARARRDGSLVAIELKCTFHPTLAPPWHYRMQLQAQMAAMECRHGLLVVGERWVADHEPDGPIRCFVVEPHQPTVDLLRTVATEAWGLVEELRAVKDAKRCRELWEQSWQRMRSYADTDAVRLEDALGDLSLDTDGLEGAA